MTEVVLTVDRRGDGQLQVAITADGLGYRIAGPKYDGSGKTVLRHVLTERDKDEIQSYLRTTATADKQGR